MKTFLPKAEYKALLEMDPGSALWTWHHSLIEPRALALLARRLPELTGYTYQDEKERPLALFLARLFFELGVITHGAPVGGKHASDHGSWHVRPEFLDAEGHVRVVFSFGAPWGLHEVPPAIVNDFLAQAIAVGDGTPQEIRHVSGGVPVGLRIDRAIDLLWDSAGAGRQVMEPEDPGSEDLIYAFDMGSELRLVNCGRPRFTAIDLEELAANGWSEIIPPMPSFGFPRTFVFQDPTSSLEDRFYLPGTEAGGRFRLSGAAFTTSGEDYYAVSEALGDSGPIIRAHFDYLPGWRTPVLGKRREWAWSFMDEAGQLDLVSRFPMVREG